MTYNLAESEGGWTSFQTKRKHISSDVQINVLSYNLGVVAAIVRCVTFIMVYQEGGSFYRTVAKQERWVAWNRGTPEWMVYSGKSCFLLDDFRKPPYSPNQKSAGSSSQAYPLHLSWNIQWLIIKMCVMLMKGGGKVPQNVASFLQAIFCRRIFLWFFFVNLRRHHSEKVALHEDYSAPFISNLCQDVSNNQSPITEAEIKKTSPKELFFRSPGSFWAAQILSCCILPGPSHLDSEWMPHLSKESTSLSL